MINRTDTAAHLERGVRTGFLLGTKDYTPQRSAFCREVPSDGAFEDYADFGVTPWPTGNAGKEGAAGVHGETGARKVNKTNAGQQITVLGGEEQAMRVYNVDWEISVGITHNAINDNRVRDLETWARQAAANFEKHKDYKAFHALEVGDGVTYGACYDGLSLFNDAHIDPKSVYQTGQDNLFALALSLDNYQTVKVAASKFMDGRGNPGGYNHSLLIVPPDLEYVAAQICKNREAYDTASREMNPYAGVSRFIVAPGAWLSSTTWVLVDDSGLVKPVNLQIRQEPQLVVWDDNAAGDGGVRYYKWHARYAIFYGDWRRAAMGNT